jgi:hypothetical protein
MVQATPSRQSSVRDVLGPSQWLHVAGSGSGKWCPAEGGLVVETLLRLAGHGLDDPDIFVITPFRIVARQLRETLAA